MTSTEELDLAEAQLKLKLAALTIRAAVLELKTAMCELDRALLDLREAARDLAVASRAVPSVIDLKPVEDGEAVAPERTEADALLEAFEIEPGMRAH